jgi:hypothetical protein
MKRLFLAMLAVLATLVTANAAEKDMGLYELRIYTANEGKLDVLNAGIRDRSMKLFEKHGMTNLGFFVPVDNKENKLYYILGHKDRAARDASWKAFRAEPVIIEALAKLKDEKVVAKVEEIFLTTTDFTVPVDIKAGDSGRVFELRIYTATPNNLTHLDARFRDHTRKLFEKYGMTNLWYFHLEKGSPHEADMLYYFLAHKSVDARNKSFDEFRKDADWNKAREASEKAGGGSLTAKDGVKFVMLKPTDYSPLK